VRLMVMRTPLCGEPICPLRPPFVAANLPLVCSGAPSPTPNRPLTTRCPQPRDHRTGSEVQERHPRRHAAERVGVVGVAGRAHHDQAGVRREFVREHRGKRGDSYPYGSASSGTANRAPTSPQNSSEAAADRALTGELHDPQRLHDRSRDILPPAHRDQRNEPRGRGETALHRERHLRSQARLADPARTDEGEQPRVARELVARALGAYRLKDLDRPEHLFQLVIADLPVDFPPLDTESSPLPDAASHRPAMGRQRPLRGDERAIERFLQRALDPPGELVDRLGELGDRLQRTVLAPAGHTRHGLAADV
jgi:hypothetical protein